MPNLKENMNYPRRMVIYAVFGPFWIRWAVSMIKL